MGAKKLEFVISALSRANEAVRSANDALLKPKRALKKQANWPAWEAGFRYERD